MPIADLRENSQKKKKKLKHVYRICTVTLNDGSRLSQGSLDADTKLAAPHLIRCADAAARSCKLLSKALVSLCLTRPLV